MLQIQEVHEHLILHLDHAWEEPTVEALVILRFTVDKLPDLEGSLAIIISLYELLVSNEETDNSVEERVSDLFDSLITQIESGFFISFVLFHACACDLALSIRSYVLI